MEGHLYPNSLYPPKTPLDWLVWLEAKLYFRRRQIRRYKEFYDSEEQVLAYAQDKFKQEFGDLFFNFRDNFCSLIVDSLSERLRIEGFRMGANPDADKDAAKIWQTNFLDSDSNAAHIDALVTGESYLVVWADEEGEPTITPEPGHNLTVQYRAGTRRQVDAALKQYRDDWGTEFSTVWLPDGVYTSVKGPSASNWSEPVFAPNPLGVVPIVPLTNRARLNRHEPYSELQPIIPLQLALTKIVSDAIIASEWNAWPQRILSGVEILEDANGNKIEPFKAAKDRMILLEDENVKWGEFSSGDLANSSNFAGMIVQHISSISRVPPHYFLVGGANFPSGESLQSAEAGLVAKAKERQLYFGESWERAMRLAFQVIKDGRADAWDAETIWADPEHRSDSQRVDALVKLNQGLGVPAQQLWEDYGYTPQQIDRFRDMQEAELAFTIKKQQALAAVTGMVGGQAPAGNGTKATNPNKPPQGNAGNNARKTAA